MSEFVKQMLNREFTDAVGYTEDSVFSTFSDNIGLYFELAKSEGEDVGGTCSQGLIGPKIKEWFDDEEED